jgi:hypothetical protein
MLRFPDRPDALPLNLIWNFETTSINGIALQHQIDIKLNTITEFSRKFTIKEIKF